MKIVVNTNSLLTPLTGIGQYTYQICGQLKSMDRANDYTYYYGVFSKELFRRTEFGAASSAEQQKIDFYRKLKEGLKKIPLMKTFGQDLRTAYSRAKQFLTHERFDLYFEPNFIPLPEIYAKKTVTMVFDLSVLLYPQWHPEERVRIFKKRFFKGLKRTDVVLTSTQFIKKQIVEHLKIAPERVLVTPISCNKETYRVQPAAAVDAFMKERRLPEKFLIFVGSIEPRKNIMGLLNAYLRIPEASRRDLHILFSGPSGWKNSEVYQFIEKNGLKEKVVFLDYISDEHLSFLYNRAQALVYPSFYEGFGLPPLEAMSAGCPVVASNIPPHQEVCGEAALLVDPSKPEQIAAAIQRFISDPSLREEYKRKGLEQSLKFDWAQTARQTMAVFDSLLPLERV